MAIAGINGIQETKVFQTSLDHVLAELRLTALRLQCQVKRFRLQNKSEESDQFKGMYISEKEIDDILSDLGGIHFENTGRQSEDPLGPEEELCKRWEESITLRKKEALDRGLKLRLDVLKKLFSLSRFEFDTLLVCLLSEVDSRYQKLFAYLQDDITKKYPMVGLVMRLLDDASGINSTRLRDSFASQAPLIKYHLITLHDDLSSGPTPLLSRVIQMDERIISYLLNGDRIDSRLIPLACIVNPQKKLPDLVIPGDLKNRLQALISQHRETSLICCLSGGYDVGKREIAEAICGALGMSMMAVDMKSVNFLDITADNVVPLIFREGLLQDAVIYLDEFESPVSENKEIVQIYNSISLQLCGYPYWVILGSEKEWRGERLVGEKPCINVKLGDATYADRVRIWKRIIENDSGFVSDIDIEDLAGKFRFNSGQIYQVIALARNLAKWREPQTGLVTHEDLSVAARRQSGENLNSLTRKIQPSYIWEDIILPKDQMEELHEICNYVHHYHTVYDIWGFGRKLSMGKGLNVLFAGPSGTGKTMAAEVIANELKIDLYKIDLSSIVSKYIGETEKNLDKIFREGRTSNAILFFDEADALFGKRSEVRDSHDRYANIETAYLLQKMDEYEGIVILATNLRKNMDEAFARRMHYSLEFPVPEESDRFRIWQNVFPRETPLSKEADIRFMARQFKITGGNIKNIAVNAAFLAAGEGAHVNMAHLIRATMREYQKIGKLCTEGDFGKYFELVKS